MRAELRLRYDQGAAVAGDLQLADGRRVPLDAAEVARINGATARGAGGREIAAIVEEREVATPSRKGRAT